MIECYFHKKEGYNPYLISDGWQVAQLNHQPMNSFDAIDDVEVHSHTDEAFVLFKGKAVLIATDSVNSMNFECIQMKPGVTYNIPAGTWHNIAMDRDVEIIIVEKSDTHKCDCTHSKLNQEQRQKLYKEIMSQL